MYAFTLSMDWGDAGSVALTNPYWNFDASLQFWISYICRLVALLLCTHFIEL